MLCTDICLTVNSNRTLKIERFFGGICPHRTVWIKKSDACNVQSDLDLHCTLKVIILCLAFQGFIHPKMNGVYQINNGIMNERK